MLCLFPVSNGKIRLWNSFPRTSGISVAEICATFEISKATACRDLEELVRSKKIQRVHGGAIRLAYSSPEIPMLIRREEQAETKRRIGLAAAELVCDGDTDCFGQRIDCSPSGPQSAEAP